MIVQPPSTASGNVASTAPKIGKIPAKIIITAPVAIVKRFTTFVMATKPTFWLNEVIGRQPNTDDNALTKPSQAIEPDVSFVVASLPSPDTASADVSPIVSVAETRKINVTDTIALTLASVLLILCILPEFNFTRRIIHAIHNCKGFQMESEIADYLSTRLEALLDGNSDTGYFSACGFHD